MKLVIGTAQLGMKYGLFKKKIGSRELNKIKKTILKSQIKFIDTATAYGESQNVIGNSCLKKLNVITKIKIPKFKNINVEAWLSKTINKTLNNLKIKKIYSVLVHDYRDLIGKRGKLYLNCLKELKKKKLIKKIGISIYNPRDLKKIWKFWKPDIVQAPFNPLDVRLISSGWLKVLKRFKVKIFVRSVFLQGLLINDFNKFIKNKNHINIINKFDNWCHENSIPRTQACLHFAKQINKIDYIIVGFDNSSQLEQIISYYKKKLVTVPNKFSTNQINLIDPRKWR
jgi:aryl-alcohol dehydrogenase-like predicted oxidoreductase